MIDPDKKVLLYFGCLREVGHFLEFHGAPYSIHNAKLLERFTKIKVKSSEIFGSIDGKYTPTGTNKQGAAKFVETSEYKLIAWHDYTIDSRGNSNSALIGFGYESAEEMLKDAAEKYPSVMGRQPGPLRFDG